MNITTHSVEETRLVGAKIAEMAQWGDIYALSGELGTGKTEFVRGFVHSIVPDIIVRSPSFSILNIYETPRFPIYHLDFYRLNDPGELIEIGFAEYMGGDGVCLIEWGTMFPEVLPSETKIIRFWDDGDSVRRIEMED